MSVLLFLLTFFYPHSFHPYSIRNSIGKQSSQKNDAKAAKATISATKKAAIQRREMFQLSSGQVIHSSDLTKEQALENLHILGQVQMMAFAKKHDVGRNCPEEFRHGLRPTDSLRKNITLFLTGKECKYIHHLILSIYHLYPTSTGASHHFLLIQISHLEQTNLNT